MIRSERTAEFIELRFWNFRALRWSVLPLSDLTVLVGRNGAGKSTIAQALNILGEALSEGLEQALIRADGALSLRSRPLEDGDSRMGLSVRLRHKGVEWVYGFILRFPSRDDYYIEEESLQAVAGPPETLGFWNRNGEVSAICDGGITAEDIAAISRGYLAFPVLGARQPQWDEILKALKAIRSYQLIPEHIRAPHEAGSSNLRLSRDGSNAADVLYNLRGSGTKEWIVEHLGATTPGIVGVSTQTFGSMRFISIQQMVNGRVEDFSVHALSEGTVRMLGALLALRQDPRPSLIFLDELEADLHPPVIAVLFDAIASCLEETQIVVASHSAEALSHRLITSDRVRILEWEHGTSEIYGVHQNVKKILKPPESIGGLLSIGALRKADRPYRLKYRTTIDQKTVFLGEQP